MVFHMDERTQGTLSLKKMQENSLTFLGETQND